MTTEKNYGLLRNVLRALGLSQEAVNDIVNWIADLLVGKNESNMIQAPEFPYRLREHFLTPAELGFFIELRKAVGESASLSAKVGLNDLFQVKTEDQSRYRIYTNKIDRKHLDFLLCDPATMHPLVGIELDDKSHQRPDRQARDEFVDHVFAAANLPVLHVPVKRAYLTTELSALLAPYLGATSESAIAAVPAEPTAPIHTAETSEAPLCPKCGGAMVLRTAKNGANAGNRFWGCASYPACRSILPFITIK